MLGNYKYRMWELVWYIAQHKYSTDGKFNLLKKSKRLRKLEKNNQKGNRRTLKKNKVKNHLGASEQILELKSIIFLQMTDINVSQNVP